MVLNMQEYINILRDKNITISYNGPLWEEGIKSMAEMVKTRLSQKDLSKKASKTLFSVFVEQVTNMFMYSAEKEHYGEESNEDVPTGMLVMGSKENTYFIQTGNAIKKESVELVKSRIDHLNSLNKDELRQYNKEMMRSENDNPESKGAGLGLIEIARRATAPIQYTIEPVDESVSFFSMYVEITQGEG